MEFVCYFCGNKDFTILRSKGFFNKCVKCGLISLSKEEKISNTEEYYSSTYYTESFTGRKNLKSAFAYRLPFINSFMKKDKEILEIGAASGDFLNILKKFGYSVRGVELSSRAVEVAKNIYGLDLFCGTIDRAHFADNSFYSIVAYHVLEHIEDVRGFLKEIYRIMKPDGVFLVEVPNPNSIDGYFSEDLMGSILDYPNHNFAFPPKVLKILLREAGFEILYTEKSFSYFISSFINKIKSYLVQAKSKDITKNIEANTENSWGDISDYKKVNFKHKLLGQLFPGMKFTIIVKKPKVVI